MDQISQLEETIAIKKEVHRIATEIAEQASKLSNQNAGEVIL